MGGWSCVEASGTNFGGVAWADPVISGDAHRLNGQGPGPDGGLGRRSGRDDNRDFIKKPTLTARGRGDKNRLYGANQGPEKWRRDEGHGSEGSTG